MIRFFMPNGKPCLCQYCLNAVQYDQSILITRVLYHYKIHYHSGLKVTPVYIAYVLDSIAKHLKESNQPCRLENLAGIEATKLFHCMPPAIRQSYFWPLSEEFLSQVQSTLFCAEHSCRLRASAPFGYGEDSFVHQVPMIFFLHIGHTTATSKFVENAV